MDQTVPKEIYILIKTFLKKHKRLRSQTKIPQTCLFQLSSQEPEGETHAQKEKIQKHNILKYAVTQLKI